MTEKEFNIRFLSDVSGLSVPNIRIWEKRYKVLRPKRTSTNIRKYSKDDLHKIVLLKYLVDSGYRIGKISSKSLADLRLMVKNELVDESYYHDELKVMISYLLEQTYTAFENYLEERLTDLSPTDFVMFSLEPLLHLLKVMESLKDENDYFSRFVANKIMQTMLALTYRMSKGISKNMEILILQSDDNFIPARLSIVNYLATLKRYRTDIVLHKVHKPFIESLKQRIKPDIVYTEFNEKQTSREISEYLSILELSFPLSRIIVSGKRMSSVWKDIPNKIYYARSFENLIRSL